MLRELHISNLAVIADARIDLAAGLNCFTGATGAGKSLVIGAIEMLLGLRSGAEMLRGGADEGRVSGLFEIHHEGLLKAIGTAADLPLDADGGQLLLTRRLFASGRTSVSLNGNPITLAMLRQVAEMLIDVHGQHDHQYLLKPSNQLDVLDQFGKLDELRAKYHAAYAELQEARKRLEALSAGRTLRQQQLELYRFQAQEIDAANLNAAEYQELQARSSVLSNLEKLKRDASAVHASIYESDGSVLERLKMAGAILAELASLDPGLKETAQNTRDAAIQVEEAAFDLSRYLNRLDLDPGELAEVEERLNTVNRILSKYGNGIEQALAYRAQLAEKIEELARDTDDLSSLTQRLSPLERRLRELGGELSSRRRAVARKLCPSIQVQLAELGMDKARFEVEFVDGSTSPAASGFDQIEFMAQTNPGQAAQPLRKIASGGELSRIMLGLKGILAQGDRVSVLVFDEVDANVGGRLGAVIGRKLRDLARHHQVLCITHLPQIACFADRHLTVRKHIEGKTTHSSVRPLDGAERLEELAEMIGGQHVTDTTRRQARELLDAAAPEASPPRSNSRRRRG